MYRTILSIQTNRIHVSLIEDDPTEGGYIVFTRCPQNYDLDDVDHYKQLSHAQARFSYLANALITTGWVPNIKPSK